MYVAGSWRKVPCKHRDGPCHSPHSMNIAYQYPGVTDLDYLGARNKSVFALLKAREQTCGKHFMLSAAFQGNKHGQRHYCRFTKRG